MDVLPFALDSRHASEIRKAALTVLHAAFDHQVHDVEVPLPGDGMAMNTLLVAANP